MALFLHDVIRASPAQTSLFLFLSALSAVLVGNAIGRVSDRPGARRLILVGGAFAGIAAFVTYAVVRDYWVLLAVALTLVAASGSLMPQVFAFGREILDQNHPTRAMMGMNNRTLRKIIQSVIIIQLFIMSPFIAIAPENNRRMIGIAYDHLLYQFGARLCTVGFLPAGQFIEHIQSQ